VKKKREQKGPPRISVKFPLELYQTLGEIPRKRKVSTAWVVRETAEKIMADQEPLFSEEIRGKQWKAVKTSLIEILGYGGSYR
jgi:predicted DNA-binding protein